MFTYTQTKNNFIKANVNEPKEILLQNVYVPFGINKNYTIKFQFSKQNEFLASELTNIDKEHCKYLHEIYFKTDMSVQHIYKVQKKSSYLSTILCTIPQIKKQIQTIVKSSRKELNTVFTLQHKKVDIKIKNSYVWINTDKKIISPCWIVTHIKVL